MTNLKNFQKLALSHPVQSNQNKTKGEFELGF
jgi:hypothetical protein